MTIPLLEVDCTSSFHPCHCCCSANFASFEGEERGEKYHWRRVKRQKSAGYQPFKKEREREGREGGGKIDISMTGRLHCGKREEEEEEKEEKEEEEVY